MMDGRHGECVGVVKTRKDLSFHKQHWKFLLCPRVSWSIAINKLRIDFRSFQLKIKTPKAIQEFERKKQRNDYELFMNFLFRCCLTLVLSWRRKHLKSFLGSNIELILRVNHFHTRMLPTTFLLSHVAFILININRKIVSGNAQRRVALGKP